MESNNSNTIVVAPLAAAPLFQVSLDLFEGPIDLLLHLVKKNELPIEKLSLALVADQYLKCIEEMQRIDFDVAGEYLVIAATLLSVKSSYVLNEPADIQIESDSGPSPHDELLRRLKEAEIYKSGARDLSQRVVLGIDVFGSSPSHGAVVSEVRLKDHDPMLLGKAFRKLLLKASTEVRSMVISVDPGTIADRMIAIVDKLTSSGGSLEFESLIGEAPTIGIIVSSFIALLELCKRQAISVNQDENTSLITVSLAGHTITVEEERVSEFDIVMS